MDIILSLFIHLYIYLPIKLSIFLSCFEPHSLAFQPTAVPRGKRSTPNGALGSFKFSFSS